MAESGPQTQEDTLQSALSGAFVEFGGPDWPQLLHSIRSGMDERGVGWRPDGLPINPTVERPSLDDAVAGARQPSQHLPLSE